MAPPGLVPFPNQCFSDSDVSPAPLTPRKCGSGSAIAYSVGISEGHPNHFTGIPPTDIDSFDFTQMEDGARANLLGRDDCLSEMPPPQQSLSAELDQIEDIRDIEILFASYASLVNPILPFVLMNWLGRRAVLQDGCFEAPIDQGLGNMLVRRNSGIRRCASEPVANLQCLGRFRAGGGVCRIWWLELTKLGDCTCQPVNIGHLHFNATG